MVVQDALDLAHRVIERGGASAAGVQSIDTYKQNRQPAQGRQPVGGAILQVHADHTGHDAAQDRLVRRTSLRSRSHLAHGEMQQAIQPMHADGDVEADHIVDAQGPRLVRQADIAGFGALEGARHLANGRPGEHDLPAVAASANPGGDHGPGTDAHAHVDLDPFDGADASHRVADRQPARCRRSGGAAQG